ncbi:hypothetical protein CTAYLR_001418 [Chrysophaeum taylorii]|uniref:Uncharacterized protein n=1 Tax=Chrysophaeum taylorii TaxID=2483200 RepID=A0AAD7UB22_9STRA|nr:hypothetical protein CTAYLR_001418 [Chrysophaeum taylorii]
MMVWVRHLVEWLVARVLGAGAVVVERCWVSVDAPRLAVVLWRTRVGIGGFGRVDIEEIRVSLRGVWVRGLAIAVECEPTSRNGELESAAEVEPLDDFFRPFWRRRRRLRFRTRRFIWKLATSWLVAPRLFWLVSKILGVAVRVWAFFALRGVFRLVVDDAFLSREDVDCSCERLGIDATFGGRTRLATLKIDLANARVAFRAVVVKRLRVDAESLRDSLRARIGVEDLSIALDQASRIRKRFRAPRREFFVAQRRRRKPRVPPETLVDALRRPTRSVDRDPRAWWRYAILVVVARIRDRKPRDAWREAIEAARLREGYVDLFRTHALGLPSFRESPTTKTIFFLGAIRRRRALDRRAGLSSLAAMERALTRDQIRLYRALAATHLLDYDVPHSRSAAERFHELNALASAFLPRRKNGAPPASREFFFGAKKSLELETSRPLVLTFSDPDLRLEASFAAVQIGGRLLRFEARVDDLVATSAGARLATLDGADVSASETLTTVAVRKPALFAGPAATALATAALATNDDDDVDSALPSLDQTTTTQQPSFLAPAPPAAAAPPQKTSPRRRLMLRVTDFELEVQDDSDLDARAVARLFFASASIEGVAALRATFRDVGLEARARGALSPFVSSREIDVLCFGSTVKVNVPHSLDAVLDPNFRDSINVAASRFAFAVEGAPATTKRRKQRRHLAATVASAVVSVPDAVAETRSTVELRHLNLSFFSRGPDARFDLDVAAVVARGALTQPLVEIAPRPNHHPRRRRRDRNEKTSSSAVIVAITFSSQESTIFASLGDARARASPRAVEALAPALSRWLSGGQPKRRPAVEKKKKLAFASATAGELSLDCFDDEGTRVVSLAASDVAAHGHAAHDRWGLRLASARISGGPTSGYRDAFELGAGSPTTTLVLNYDSANREARLWLSRPRLVLGGKFLRETSRFFRTEVARLRQFCRPQPRESSPRPPPLRWKVTAVGAELVAPRRSRSDDVVAMTIAELEAASDDGSPIGWPSNAAKKNKRPPLLLRWRPRCRVLLRRAELFAALGWCENIAESFDASCRVASPDGVRANRDAFRRLPGDGSGRPVPRWQPLSGGSPTDFRIALDASEETLRILVEDADETGVKIDASMREFYAFLSATYFDNYQEGAAPWVPPPPSGLSAYGTESWIQEMLEESNVAVEIALRFSSVALDLSLDDDDDAAADDDDEGGLTTTSSGFVPSLFMAKPPNGANGANGGGLQPPPPPPPLSPKNVGRRPRIHHKKRWPFASIRADSLLVVVTNARHSVTVSAGVRGLAMRDTRAHVAGYAPPYSLLLAPPHQRLPEGERYVCDSALGLREGRHSIIPPGFDGGGGGGNPPRRQHSEASLAPPVSRRGCLVTVRVTEATACVAVSVDSVNILAKDLGLAWLLADYFKLYFTQPAEFDGPPSYVEQQRLPPLRPPKTIDVKVVGSRPYVAVAECDLVNLVPESGSNAGATSRRSRARETASFKAITLDVESGVFVQWTSASDDSLRVEVAAVGLRASVGRLIDAATRLGINDHHHHHPSSSGGAFSSSSNTPHCSPHESYRTSRVICSSTSFGLSYSYDARIDHVDAWFQSPLSRRAVETPRDVAVLAGLPVEPYPTCACRPPGGSISGRFGARKDFAAALDGDPLFVSGRHRSVQANENSAAKAEGLTPFKPPHVGAVDPDADPKCSRVVTTLQDAMLVASMATSLLGPFDEEDALDLDMPTTPSYDNPRAPSNGRRRQRHDAHDNIPTATATATAGSLHYCVSSVDDGRARRAQQIQQQQRGDAARPALKRAAASTSRLRERKTVKRNDDADEEGRYGAPDLKIDGSQQARTDEGSTSSARLRVEAIDVALVDSVFEEYLPIARVRLRRLSCASFVAHDVDESLLLNNFERAASLTSAIDQRRASPASNDNDDRRPFSQHQDGAARHQQPEDLASLLLPRTPSASFRPDSLFAAGDPPPPPPPTLSSNDPDTPTWTMDPTLAYAVGTEAATRPLATHVIVSAPSIAADYFNSMLKCWEPFVAPFEVELILELSSHGNHNHQSQEHDDVMSRQTSFDASYPPPDDDADDDFEFSTTTRPRTLSEPEDAARRPARFRGNGVCVRAPKRLDLNLTDAAMEPLARLSCIVAATLAETAAMRGDATAENNVPNNKSAQQQHPQVKTASSLVGRHQTGDGTDGANQVPPSRTESASGDYVDTVPTLILPSGTDRAKAEMSLGNDNFGGGAGGGEREEEEEEEEEVLWQVEHVRAPRADHTRDAFSLSNQTGLELRAYQPQAFYMSSEEHRRAPQYLVYVENNHKIRIHFSATRTIPHNRRVREVAFSEEGADAVSRCCDESGGPSIVASLNQPARELHDPESEEIDVQLPGFRWVRVSINEFRRPGVSFHELRPMIGSVGASAVLSRQTADGSRRSWAFTNALRLAADVKAHGGGRTLALRSVFGVRNCAGHALEFRFDISDLSSRKRRATRSDSGSKKSGVLFSEATPTDEVAGSSKPLEDNFDPHAFVLAPNDACHVPVAAIHDALLCSNAQSLGAISLRPATSDDVASAMGCCSDEHREAYVRRRRPESRNVIWTTTAAGSESATFKAYYFHECEDKDDDDDDDLNDDDLNDEGSFATTRGGSLVDRRREGESDLGRAEEKGSVFSTPQGVPEDKEAQEEIELSVGDGVSPDMSGLSWKPSREIRRATFGDSRIALRDLVDYSREQFADGISSSSGAASSAINVDDTVVRAPFSDENIFVDHRAAPIQNARAAVGTPPPQTLSVECSIVEADDGEASRRRRAAAEPGKNGSRRFCGVQYQHPICYCVEVRRSPLYPAYGDKHPSTVGNPVHAPVDYEILVHAPLQMTNYLSEVANFELVHASTGHRLWYHQISPGSSVPVHTVGLDAPLALRVSLPEFCRSVDPPAVIHPPVEDLADHADVDTYATVADEIGQKLDICVSSRIGGGGQRHVIAYVPFWMVNLTQYSIRYAQEGARDQLPAGTVFGGAQELASPSRSSEWSYVPRLASLSKLPGAAGPLAIERLERKGPALQPPHEQISQEMDEAFLCSSGFMFNFNMASAPVRANPSSSSSSPESSSSARSKSSAAAAAAAAAAAKRKKTATGAHAGRRGLASAATTFFVQSPQVQIQVGDSEWSSSFSLDTIGVSQVLSVKHPKKGLIELGFSISFAPGARSAFTKVALGLNRDELIGEVPSDTSRPFHLPQARAERNLQLKPAGPFEKTPPFPVDVAHDFFLKVPHSVNDPTLAFSSRGDEYTVVVPPEAADADSNRFDLGLWLETDWKQRGIVVKRVKPRTWAQVETDITKGDELLEINGQSLKKLSFGDAIAAMRQATTALLQGGEPVEMRFRSVEARMRMIRMRALHRAPEEVASAGGNHRDREEEGEEEEYKDEHVSVEIKAVGASVLLDVVPMDTKFPPYRIVNRSASYRVLYRQRDVLGAPWMEIGPRSSVIYVWEDPMKSHRLQVRVAADTGQSEREVYGTKPRAAFRLGRLGLLVSDSSAADAGGATRTIQMDEINHRDKLAVPSVASDFASETDFIYARVNAEGPTRVLVITDKPDMVDQIADLENTIRNTAFNVERARRNEFERSLGLQVGAAETLAGFGGGGGGFNTVFIGTNVNELRTSTQTKPRSASDVSQVGYLSEREQRCSSSHLGSRSLGDDHVPLLARSVDPLSVTHERQIPSQIGRYKLQHNFGPTTIHRLFVEVIEARNLFSRTLHGFADPYCVLVMKTPLDKFMRRKRYYTYYVEKTLNPKWENQVFELKVPQDAAESKRGFMLRVKVKEFSLFGTHSFLGQCDVQLSHLQDEQEHTGWFPLMQRSAKIYRSQDIVTGYLRLRVRWVYTRLGLLRSKYAAARAHTKQLEQMHQAQQNQLRSLKMQQRQQHLGRALSRQLKDYEREPTMFGVLRKLRVKERTLIATRAGARLWRKSTAVHHVQQQTQKGIPLSKLVEALSPTSRAVAKRQHRQQQQKWRQKWASAREKLMQAVRDGKVPMLAPAEETPPASWSSSLAFPASSVSKSEYFWHKMRHAHALERLAILERVRESYTRIKTEGGILEIQPLQALNLNMTERHVFLNVRYGPTVDMRSPPSIPGIVHRWARDQTPEEGVVEMPPQPASSSKRKREKKISERLRIDVEEGINKSFGTLQLSIYAEHVASNAEIGRVELPMMNVLECLSARNEYVRWFPLAPANDCVHFEGDDGENWWVHGSEEATPTGFKEKMSIQLALRWEPFHPRNQDPTKFYVCAVLAGLSVTLSKTRSATALLHATVSDVDVIVEESNKRTRVATGINWVQIDNQLPMCHEAVVLAPTLTDSLQPVFQLRLSRNNSEPHGNFLSFKYISVMLQELDIRVDQSLLLALWHFVSEAVRHDFCWDDTSIVASTAETTPRSSVARDGATSATALAATTAGGAAAAAKVSTPKPRRPSSSARQQRSASKVYIERLCLFPVKINLTIGKGSDASPAVDRYLPVHDIYLHNFHGLALQAFIKLLADFFLSVTATLNGAPIKLNALFVWHVFNTPEHIASSLREHYLNSLLRQLYKLVASLDYIGNPMSLVNALGTGVRDFFFEPAEGLFLGPSAFALGAMRGTLSLVGNATSGILTTAARVTTTVGRIVAYPVLDADYNRWRVNQGQRGRVSHVQPLLDVGSGFVRGVTGIVEDPYRGAQKDGAKGFCVGLFKGVVGVAVKPVVGVIDAYAHATEHLQQITTQFTSDRRAPVRRLRFGAAFGIDSRLLPYDFAIALSHATLRDHPLVQRRPRNGAGGVNIDVPEVVVWSELLGTQRAGKLLLVTPHRAICAKLRQDHGLIQTELEWAALLSDDRAIVEPSLADTGSMGGLELYVARRPSKIIRGPNGSPRDPLRVVGRSHHHHHHHQIAGNEGLPFHRGLRWVGAEFDEDGSCHKIGVEHRDRQSLVSMFNAINAVLGNFDVIHPDDATSRDANRVTFGDWHFGPDARALAPLATFRRIESVLDNLSLVEWHSSSALAALPPRHPLFERSQLWHKQARGLMAKVKRDPRDTDRIALFKQKLYDNAISAVEFDKFVEDEVAAPEPDAFERPSMLERSASGGDRTPPGSSDAPFPPTVAVARRFGRPSLGLGLKFKAPSFRRRPLGRRARASRRDETDELAHSQSEGSPSVLEAGPFRKNSAQHFSLARQMMGALHASRRSLQSSDSLEEDDDDDDDDDAVASRSDHDLPPQSDAASLEATTPKDALLELLSCDESDDHEADHRPAPDDHHPRAVVR